MTTETRLVAAALRTAVLPGVCRADDDREKKPRFKGVELYSWQDEKGRWVFVLLNGTNREKTEAEVKGAANPVRGAAELAKALSRLARGEYVSWNHGTKGFKYPSEAARDEIRKAADAAEVHLHIGKVE